MPSTESYLHFIQDQLSGLDGVSWRAMMGEYILYYRGRIAGGIYDDRLLVKPTAAARRLLPTAGREIPYPGAKELLLVDDVENRALLETLLTSMYAELPAPRKRK